MKSNLMKYNLKGVLSEVYLDRTKILKLITRYDFRQFLTIYLQTKKIKNKRYY